MADGPGDSRQQEDGEGSAVANGVPPEQRSDSKTVSAALGLTLRWAASGQRTIVSSNHEDSKGSCPSAAALSESSSGPSGGDDFVAYPATLGAGLGTSALPLTAKAVNEPAEDWAWLAAWTAKWLQEQRVRHSGSQGSPPKLQKSDARSSLGGPGSWPGGPGNGEGTLDDGAAGGAAQDPLDWFAFGFCQFSIPCIVWDADRVRLELDYCGSLQLYGQVPQEGDCNKPPVARFGYNCTTCARATEVGGSGPAETPAVEGVAALEDIPGRLLSLADGWEGIVSSRDEAWFSSHFSYSDTSGAEVQGTVGKALAQVFNHGTHHRGQLTSAISEDSCQPYPVVQIRIRRL
ncbi:unnamed protein product [Polarella glacialis]|uniref:Uncharacterized protein n=1 Tax=Polarella glacialis TaxID=89957 RepID=A0A813DJT9_POLGL|nr:unnamed protein product [Polarella glacialis]